MARSSSFPDMVVAMRSLLPVVLLGACSFAPGQVQGGGDGGTSSVDGASTTDGAMTLIDASVDASPSPNKVRAIDIVDANVADGPHTDFPLLVSLSETWLRSTANGGNVANAEGFDIYFTSDAAGATPLAHEVESYDDATGALVAWVKVPSLAATTTIYLHYGDPAITATREDADAVWSNNYELVMHLTDTTDASANNGAPTGANVLPVAGRIAGAHSFNGTTSTLNIGSGAAVDDIFGSGGGTVETWYYAETYGTNSLGRLFDKGNVDGYSIFIDNVNATASISILIGCNNGGSCYGQWHIASVPNPLNTWHHLAVVYDRGALANNPVVYIDGASVTVTRDQAPTGATDSDAAASLYLGSNQPGSRMFDGLLDEARLSSSNRSAGWIETQFANQSNPSAFYAVSAPL